MPDPIRLTRGVWRPTEQTVELVDRCAAVLTVLPGGAVLSGPTAALLRGTWLPDRFAGLIEVTVPASVDRLPHQWPRSVRAEILLRRRTLRAADVTVVDGLPVTDVARTWIDLAEVLHPAELIAAGDWSIGGRCSLESLTEQTANARHRRGVRLARSCLPLLSDRSESRPESHLRAAVVLGGLPEPEVNVDVVAPDGTWVGRPDLLLREWRIALEYQGSDHADPRRMRRDMTRWGDLRLTDLDVLLFGPVEVFRYPDRVPTLIRSVRARRRLSA